MLGSGTQSCWDTSNSLGQQQGVSAEGLGWKKPLCDRGSSALLMLKIIFVSREREPSAALWLIPLAKAEEKNYSSREVIIWGTSGETAKI